MICHKRKIVFIHIPKTGGQSIEHFLFPDYNFNEDENKTIMYGWNNKVGWLNHLTCSEIKSYGNIPDKKYEEYFKFTFVRNPWERLISEYAWKFYNNFKLFKQFCIDISEMNYENWISNYKDPLAFVQHIKAQHEYIYDSKGNLEINFLGKYENFNRDFQSICEGTNLKYNEPYFYNKSKHKHYTYYYDKLTKELVSRIYKDDIEIFNYSFGN